MRLELNERAWVLFASGEKQVVQLGEMEPVPIAIERSRRAWAVDRRGQKLQRGDIVKAPRSHAKTAPVKAEILFVQGQHLFLKACEGLTGERAYTACAGGKCEYMYNRPDFKRITEPAEKKVSTTQGTISYGITMASETSWLKPWTTKLLCIDADATLADGAAVRITGGHYKGLRGEIRANLGEKVRVSLLCKPKLVEVSTDNILGRMSEPVPSTPKAAIDIPVPESPRLPVEDGDDDKVAEPPNEAESWDPFFLVRPTGLKALGAPVPAPLIPDELLQDDDDKALVYSSPAAKSNKPTEGDRGGAGQTESPISEPFVSSGDEVGAARRASGSEKGAAGAADRATGVGSTSGDSVDKPITEWRRRPVRAPPRSALGRSPMTPSRLDSSPRSPLMDLEAKTRFFETGAPATRREAWLQVGVGVVFTIKGKRCRGWIIRVVTEAVDIVMEKAEPGNDRKVYPLKGSETSPWPCDARNQAALIFDGPRRNKRGKVLGFDAGKVLVRVEENEPRQPGQGSLLGLFGSQLVQVDAPFVARYNHAWVQAVESEKLYSQRLVGSAPSQAGDTSSPNEPFSLTNSVPESFKGMSDEASVVEDDVPSPAAASIQDSDQADSDVEWTALMGNRPRLSVEVVEAQGAVSIQSSVAAGEETPSVMGGRSAGTP
eukprot:CAMPEP_0117619676 /NCGR_PEP_ID=MMETSP0784-20121206/86740_1 /TAXON_ID=39447 /ORGANISM="" /LENGTH=660 /DNA_ID=CAMNT_0005423575 /DNA_START=5 /DNA_END=1984 /DNA_ORIENTATION=-